MTVKPMVYVVLLSWNNWRDTFSCLHSLEAMDYGNWRALIVDNGSKDDSVQRLREAFPAVTLIENGRNLGFTGGCNVGMRYALEHAADYIWLLNNDTTVDSSALNRMVDCAEQHSDVGAVGSVVYWMDNPKQIQAWGGGYVNFWIGRSRLYRRPVRDSALGYIFGASIMIRRAVLETIGLLDEGFFTAWEETDFCFRARAAGWRLATATEAVIYHKWSASFVGKNDFLDAHFTRSARRFFEKHGRTPRLSFWMGVALSILKRIVVGRWKTIPAVWPGYFDRAQTPRTPSA